MLSFIKATGVYTGMLVIATCVASHAASYIWLYLNMAAAYNIATYDHGIPISDSYG